MTSSFLNTNPAILGYHHICNHLHPAITRSTVKQFEKQVQFLKTHHYKVPVLSDLLFEDQTKNKNSVFLTFDDAFSCLYENAIERLVAQEMKATIFVITKYVGQKTHWDYYKSSKCGQLNWRQLQEIANAGFEIGSHSHTHVDLHSMSKKKVKYEMEYSKKMIEDRLSRPVHFFSYPFGRFNQVLTDLCREAGYKGAITMKPKISRLNMYKLPRSSVYLFDTLAQFNAKLNQSFVEQKKLEFINFFSLGTIIVKNFQKK